MALVLVIYNSYPEIYLVTQWIVFLSLSLLHVASTALPTSYRCYPDEPWWPSVKDWDQLNQTVSGRLIQIVPLGQSCHNPDFKNSTCAALRPGINLPNI
jgi:hypothetical protein